MKKFKNLFAVVLALVLCLGAMTACSGEKTEDTQKPSSSTSGDKNESKPTESKPAESKPEESKPEESKPEESTPQESTNTVS